MSEGPHPIATSSQTVGPFFHFGLTANESLGRIASPDTPGEHIQLRVRVLDGAGETVPDAVIEIYQADAEGRYPDSTEPPAATSEPRVPSPRLRARRYGGQAESRAPSPEPRVLHDSRQRIRFHAIQAADGRVHHDRIGAVARQQHERGRETIGGGHLAD